MRVVRGGLLAVWFATIGIGCRSPEDGRPRGGGHGADGGNYVPGVFHVPSKIDGTKSWPTRMN